MTALPQKQRGVALLVALLVVALAVVLIAALLDRGELAYARTRNLLRSEQAEAYAQGLDLYAAQALLTAQSESPGLDSNASPWALPMPPQDVPGGSIGASMRDLDGCFNLNNLSPRNGRADLWKPVFARLLHQLGIEQPGLAASIEDWLDVHSDGSDMNTYLAQPVPYRPRHDVFVHVSELRLVAGVGADVYARLAPYVCALPPGTTLNVNTASAPLLASLATTISPAVAQKLWAKGQARFSSLQDFAQQAGIDLAQLPATLLAVQSRYFLVRGDVVLDDVPFTFFSLIERGQAGLRVLERSRGADDALAAAVVLAPHPAAAAE